MMKATISGILFLAVSGAAAGASGGGCEETFKKSGNPLSGTKYDAVVTVENLSVANAIAQLHGIAVASKLDILTEDAANGAMLLEDRESTWKRAIPLVVGVMNDGAAARIQVTLKLNKGVFAKADDVKVRMCDLLRQVAGGPEGEAAAARAAEAGPLREARKVDAVTLSRELARQTEESASSIPLRYKDRSFTVTGRVDYVRKDGEVYRVAFAIPKPNDVITLPGAKNPGYKIDISCLMAPRFAAWAVALREREKVTLTGTFSDFDDLRKVMWLGECRPEQ